MQGYCTLSKFTFWISLSSDQEGECKHQLYVRTAQTKRQISNLATTKWELLDVVNTFINTLVKRCFFHADAARNGVRNRNSPSELLSLLANPTDQSVPVSY